MITIAGVNFPNIQTKIIWVKEKLKIQIELIHNSFPRKIKKIKNKFSQIYDMLY